MSYQPLNIVIREAKLTDFLTDLAVIFNTNDGKLKLEVEKIVNGLQINTSTGVIGEPDSNGLIPINQINARTMFLVLPSTPSTGWKFGFKNTYNGSVASGVGYEATAYEPWSVSYASNTYSLVMGTQAAGYRGWFSRMTIDTVLQAMIGKFDIIQLSNTAGLFDCSAPAQFNGIVAHNSGHKESVDSTAKTLLLDGTKLYCVYTLGKNTPENIFVNLVVDSNGYNSGWLPGITAIELRLQIDPTMSNNLPMSGQVFKFILGRVTDPLGAPITTHPLVPVEIVANETVPATLDFAFRGFGAGTGGAHDPFKRIKFIEPVAGVSPDSLDTYGSNVSFIYSKETFPVGSIYSQYTDFLYVKDNFYMQAH